MAIGTYAELKTAIANWLNDSSLTARIPEFISIAEAEIAKDVKLRSQETRATATISTEYFDTPSDYIQIRNIHLDTDPITDLEYLTPETMDRMVPHSTTGKPLYYTIHGDEFQVKPIPDGNYTCQINYYGRFAAFSADGDNNWLLTNHPEIYLYASLKAAHIYKMAEEQAASFDQLYQTGVSRLNKVEKRGSFGESMIARPMMSTP